MIYRGGIHALTAMPNPPPPRCLSSEISIWASPLGRRWQWTRKDRRGPNLSITFYILLFSNSSFSNLDLMFFLRLYNVQRHSRWSADSRRIQDVPTPIGFLDGRWLDSRQTAPTRPIWMVHHTCLNGSRGGWLRGAPQCATRSVLGILCSI
jgi:hypothetical protein